MKTLTTCFYFLFSLSLLAQEKGVSPISHHPEASSGQTYAVVVGISDYQDKGIPDLRFADKDALAFAGFLQSPAGGSLDEDHLKVLTNKQATGAQVASALYWLMEVSQENDKVIIYFSGHGDVEAKFKRQPGFLLCWDAPARVYMAGGVVDLRMLQDVISALSLDNKSKVTVVTDACRSGKLSGSQIGGAQATTNNLAQQYANEIKILSCQPDEYSIEGEQWGGGRGAFSYHLLDGLYGMADGNGDLTVNLLEIGRYLEDHVSMEVAPQSQIPMTVGGRGEKLTNVFPEILAQLKEGKKGQMQLFTATESRGIEDDVLARADTTVVEMYFAFKQSLKDQQFLEPATACADFYYEQLSREPQLERLHSTMRRNYAAALQDDAQQAMNTMLKSGLTEDALKSASMAQLYKNYPDCLDRAAKLLGEEHYMYQILQARKYFFKGKMARNRNFYQKALKLQPNMVHAMNEMIILHSKERLDTAEYYFQKATNLVPSWVEPYIWFSGYYESRFQKMDKAENLLKLARKVDSTSLIVWFRTAQFYQRRGKYKAAEKWFLKTIEASEGDICFPCAYSNLGNVYKTTNRYEEAIKYYKKGIQLDSTSGPLWVNLGDAYLKTNQPEKAEAAFLKTLQLNINNPFPHPWAYDGLGSLALQNQRFVEAEEYFKKALELNPGFTNSHLHLGLLYIRTKRLDEAKSSLDKALEIDPDESIGRIYLAQWSLKMNQSEQAWLYLEQGLEKGLDNGQLSKEDLQEEPDFAGMRKEARWGELLEKYFPEQAKD